MTLEISNIRENVTLPVNKRRNIFVVLLIIKLLDYRRDRCEIVNDPLYNVD